jgi:type I restriction-modification system DNA methylase subunit
LGGKDKLASAQSLFTMARTSDAKTALRRAAPAEIHALVEKFAEHRDFYYRGSYNETQLRQDFLDPFFIALGWDIYNTGGIHENYRDVILEHGLRVEKSVKAPDYCIRIGPVPKFFVEAKKPAVDIKSDVGPAFQLRRYAWTAKLPLSILTDFDEFAIYDCRVKPDKHDSAATARVTLLSYTDYIDKWDEIAGIFSREAVLKGRFDDFAGSTKKKRGTAEVDQAFLEEIEAWRDSLAKNLSLRNEAITDRELNAAVQLIIDRIIFLRMCEGRDIEPYGRLQSLLNGDRVYPRLVEIFHRADEKYNSGLFHFQKEKGREPPDELTPDLIVDDKVLKDILRRLYYPESPYEFAALPADILGQVYEQFLGKVIRLTAGHRAKIEEKPEVRKAGGVYYTPTYIVEYIVENTVGKLVEGKTPQEVGGLTATYKDAKNARPLSVLDPACGSGSFLIVAYQYLLDWYLEQCIKEPEKHARGAQPRIYRTTTGDWRLTIAERKRILLSHIYGVDIDSQAVEVTKLSLLLKVLEGETEHTIRQLEAFHKERALPDLAGNIKCGNSLIGPDFFDGKQRELFDEADMLRINAFDWKGKHGFPQIFAGDNPGFDAVIGNPPYIDIVGIPPIQREYFTGHYSTFAYRSDILGVFIHRAIDALQETGLIGFITSNVYFASSSGEKLRQYMLEKLAFERLIDIGGGVFSQANVDTAIFIARKVRAGTHHKIDVAVCRTLEDFGGVARGASPIIYQIKQSDLLKRAGCTFEISSSPAASQLVQTIRVRGERALGEIFEFCRGFTAYDAHRGHSQQLIKNRVFHSDHRATAAHRKELVGSDISSG